MRPPLAVICDRVASRPICEVPGASRRVCAYCSAECWISPASLAVMAQTPGSVVSCIPCYRVHGRNVPLVTTAAHVAEARAVLEIRRAQALKN